MLDQFDTEMQAVTWLPPPIGELRERARHHRLDHRLRRSSMPSARS
jgi:hypothetical protein